MVKPDLILNIDDFKLYKMATGKSFIINLDKKIKLAEDETQKIIERIFKK